MFLCISKVDSIFTTRSMFAFWLATNAILCFFKNTLLYVSSLILCSRLSVDTSERKWRRKVFSFELSLPIYFYLSSHNYLSSICELIKSPFTTKKQPIVSRLAESWKIYISTVKSRERTNFPSFKLINNDETIRRIDSR